MTAPLLRPLPRTPLRLSALVYHPRTDAVIMILIVLSIVLLGLEEWLDRSESRLIVLASDAITWVFVGELSLKFLVAKKKLRFFWRHSADILAVLPLLRPLRIFRLFRLLRLFQLGVILDRRVAMLRSILRINFYFLWVLLMMTGVLIIGGAVGEYLVEAEEVDGVGVVSQRVEPTTPTDFRSINRSLWWATYSLIAGEPVGDMPQTELGRALLLCLMLSGMGLFAVFTGMVSATMIDRLQKTTGLGLLDLDELEGHLVVCGWNQGAKPLLAELAVDLNFSGQAFVLVNELSHPPDLSDLGLRSDHVYHVQGDFTQLEVLKRAQIEQAHRAVVLADDSERHQRGDRDARSVLAALTIERLHPNIYCVVELMNAANKEHLAVAGVEAIIMRNDLSGRALASACRHPRLATVMMDLLTSTAGARLERVPGPVQAMAYGELLSRCKEREGAIVLGVETDAGQLFINPSADHQVKSSDFLVMVRGGAKVTLPTSRATVLGNGST